MTSPSTLAARVYERLPGRVAGTVLVGWTS